MLKRLRVSNFRSLANVVFEPTGLNVIVGRNGAGKTNLCAAMRFLSAASHSAIDLAAFSSVGETWNLSNVHVSSRRMEFVAECDLQYDNESCYFTYLLVVEPKEDLSGTQGLRVAEERLTVSGGKFKETVLIDNDGTAVRLFHEVAYVERNNESYAETVAPDDTTMLGKLYEMKDNPRATLFKKYLGSWQYFSFQGDALRSADVYRDTSALRTDGSNLSKCLYALHNEYPRIERKLIAAVQAVEPSLDLLSYRAPDPDHVYAFFEDKDGHRFSTRSISDGALRYTALSYIAIVFSELISRMDFSPLILIEEPDNGIFVGLLRQLFESIDPHGKSGQFVFTTHSPYLVDFFDAHLDGVHLMRPGIPSSTISTLNPVHIKRLLDEMSLGEMHFREILQ